MRAVKRQRLKVSRPPPVKRLLGLKQLPSRGARKQSPENQAAPKVKRPELLGHNPNPKNQAEENQPQEDLAVLKALLPNRHAVKQQQVNPLVQVAQLASRAEASHLPPSLGAHAAQPVSPLAVSPPRSHVVRVVKFRDQLKTSGVAAYSTQRPFSIGLEAEENSDL